MQPNISLLYDSRSSIGPLGVGWSLAGLGQITRCNLTVAQDTTPAPVALVTSDGYCINGNRLRLTSGTSGTAGSTYQTEIADFSNITANGTAGNGPQYFTVQGRNGLTYYYGYTDSNGNGANSQALAYGSTTALSWFLSKIVDRAGNNLVINYLAQTGPSPPAPTVALSGTAVPADILWTPISAGASTYTYKMQFNYGTNVQQSSVFQFVAGTPVVNAELLTSIEVFLGTTVVKDYFLTYQTSPLTGRDELIDVKECADSAGTDCLLPTTISYQLGSPGLSTVSNGALSSSGAFLTTRYDLNGDGYPDLIYNPTGTGQWYVAFGSASGYGTPINTGITGGGFIALIGNVTGGKQDGFLVVNSGVWWFYRWNGSSFVGTSTGLAHDSAAQYQLADINGDGLPDLVEISLAGPNGRGFYTATVYTRLNTSSGGTPSFSATLNTANSFAGSLVTAQLMTPDMQWAKLRRYDFNGDGRDDVVVQTTTGTSPSFTVSTYELISTGTSFNTTLIQSVAASAYPTMFFTDWNDDQCTDVVTLGTLYVSGCNGTVPVSYAIGTVLAAIDYDGDGRTDLLVANGSTLGVYLSKATGAPTLTSTTIPYVSTCQYVWMDANGDGQDDLGCWSQTGSNPLTYYLHNGTSDLATSFVDGYGNSASPLYVLISQGGYYSAWNDQVFPYQDYIGPLYVVYQTTFSDPSTSNGTYQQTFWYAGASLNLQGRGFAGFGAQQRLDSRNGIWETAEYGRVFPYTGMLTYDVQAQDNLNTEPIRTVTNTLNASTLDGTMNTQRVFPYISNQKIQNYEVGGAENADLITTTSTTYAFDPYGNATTIAKTVTDNDPGSPYSGQQWTTTIAATISASPSTWCNSLPTERDVTKTAPGVPAITRHVSFTADYSLCHETQQVVEAGNSTYQVTTGYGFDAFGNIDSQTVTGIGMAARTTAINWGTTGQFPAQVTNPLNQISILSFDPATGQPLSFKDPNGISTSWQYDPFGRKNKEIRPDGTYTVWSYNDCTVWGGGGCLHGPHSLALGHYVYSTTGAVLSVGSDWFDQVDRPIIKNSVNIAGTFDRSDVRYDSLGNISAQSMPCAWGGGVLTPCTYWTTNSYDALGRETQTQRPISATNSTLQTTTIQYSGRTTTITDPQGKVTTNITKVTGSVGRTKDHNGYYINFNHDAFGSLLSVTDSLSNTLRTMTPYAYGIAAFKTSMTDMDLGSRSYTHDALGEVTAYSDGKGQNFSAVFDALSRLTSRTEPDLTSHWTWGATAASHNIGKLASVTSTGSGGTYSESYTFDSIGRLSNETITLPNDGTPAFDYAYSPTTGLLSTLTYPPSFPSTYRLTAGYTYQNGFLQQIFDSLVPTTIWWQANTMNPRGQITEETTEDLSGHPQIISTRTYDAVTGWLGSTQTGPEGGATLQNEAYLYDEMGNVTQRQNNNLGLTENFYYDNLYRLDHSTLGGNTNLQMAYDAMGDITSRSDVAAGATWAYDPVRKHAVTQAGSSAFTNAYDANGNVTSRNGSIIGWTSYNYPDGVTTATESATFDYAPNRQRWRMIYSGPSGNETTFYATPKFEKVYAGGGGEYRSYIYAGNRPVVVVMRNTASQIKVRSLLVDHQGSISSIVTDSTGASLVSESFTAYGNRREASTWSGAPTSTELATMNGVTRGGYTFQTVLGSMGLNHMNGRIEDSVTGRFLSPDPRGTIPGNTQSWNRYSYVLNNPLTFSDPTGFDCTVGGDGNAVCEVDSGGGGGAPAAAGNGFGPSISSPPASITAPKKTYVAGVGTQPTVNTYSVDGNGLETITVSIYSPDVASSPASNGVNLAPIFASTAFTSYQPAINAAFKAMIIELGLFNPAILDGLTLLQDTPLPTVSLSTNQVAACTACALSLVGQSLEFEAVITNILGEEVPFEEINLGPETETPLQSGNEAFDEALSRAIWGNQPPPLPPH